MGCPCNQAAPIRSAGLFADLQTSVEDKVRREMLLPMGLAFVGGLALGALVGGLVVAYTKR